MSRNLDMIRYALERVAESEVGGAAQVLDARAKLLASLIFLGTMLSVPIVQVGRIAVWALPLMVVALACGVSYLRIAGASLAVLPFVAFVGAFNIVYEREVVCVVAGIAVSRGWAMAIGMVLRALISVQAILLLVRITGVQAICRAMQRLGVPAIFAAQMLFVYRFLSLMIRELQSMMRAVDSRSAGRRNYPLRLWGQIVAELLLRSTRRARAVGRAMESRLWDGGVVGCGEESKWRLSDTMFLGLFGGVTMILRLMKF